MVKRLEHKAGFAPATYCLQGSCATVAPLMHGGLGGREKSQKTCRPYQRQGKYLNLPSTIIAYPFGSERPICAYAA